MECMHTYIYAYTQTDVCVTVTVTDDLLNTKLLSLVSRRLSQSVQSPNYVQCTPSVFVSIYAYNIYICPHMLLDRASDCCDSTMSRSWSWSRSRSREIMKALKHIWRESWRGVGEAAGFGDCASKNVSLHHAHDIFISFIRTPLPIFCFAEMRHALKSKSQLCIA